VAFTRQGRCQEREEVLGTTKPPYTLALIASLLRDAYVDLPEELQEDLKERFRQQASPDEPREVFRRRYDLMCVQRNLKTLGTFGFMATVRGRRDYLDYIPRTQASIHRTMTAYPRWHDAFEAFSRLALAPLS